MRFVALWRLVRATTARGPGSGCWFPARLSAPLHCVTHCVIPASEPGSITQSACENAEALGVVLMNMSKGQSNERNAHTGSMGPGSALRCARDDTMGLTDVSPQLRCHPGL